MSTSTEETIYQLQKLVDVENVATSHKQLAPFLREQRGFWRSECLAAVSPATAEEARQCVKLCAERRVSIVPQGGNTGLCGGAVSQENQVILSTRRLKKVRNVDVNNNSITVEAGCVLQDIQAQAKHVNRLFPLSLGAEGSCQIGGNLSTNAGGINVLRYGNARDLCLGIEAVLASGELISDLTGLRKDNTGYDLKNLLIGAEGTLGVITAATLKLFPRPKSNRTVLVAFDDLHHVNTFYTQLRESSGGQISTFELIPNIAIELTRCHFSEYRHPFDQTHSWYALAEVQSQTEQHIITDILQQTLASTAESAIIANAVIAQNVAQSRRLFQLRELLVEAQRLEGASIKHDISIPISSIAAFIVKANELVEQIIPGARPYPFGHFGDGNIHYNVSQPVGADQQQFLQLKTTLSDAVYDLVHQFSGSFSAEHGIGLLKLTAMQRYKSSASLQTMRSIKQALDPNNLFNPGKVLP